MKPPTMKLTGPWEEETRKLPEGVGAEGEEVRPDQLEGVDLPARWGRYDLVEILGEGGAGRVFRAVLNGPAGFEKRVALKVLKAGELARVDIDRGQELIREARLGGRLKHPHIVDTYELGSIDGSTFIAMELVDGPTLLDVLRDFDRVPQSVLLEIAIAMTEGLAKAHTLVSDGRPAGLVHCDLKPSNVLLSWDGDVKIADFGIADLTAERPTGGPRMGTPTFMSPEQFAGMKLDRRSDLFSLGLLIGSLALRRHPLGRTATSSGEGWEVPHPPLSREVYGALNAWVPELGRVLVGCLFREREERYPDAPALLADLVTLQDRVGHRPRLVTWLASMRAGVDAVDDGTQRRISGAVRDGSKDTEARPHTGTPEAFSYLSARHNLGAHREPFVGRQDELEELLGIFDRGARLVTIKGPGGAGKTRLCRQYARAALASLDVGAWFVDLTEQRSSLGIVRVVAEVLEIGLTGTENVEQLVGRLGTVLAHRGRALLLLDNFEQLVEHAGDTVERWLERAPEVQFLVTSREPLGLPGEHVFPLEPLRPTEGAELFRVRVEEVGGRLPNDEQTHSAIAQIVEQVDGLPLAIGLAAGRCNVLSLDQILERLSERFELLRGGRRNDTDRQATLHGAIRWSWELLSPWERAAMCQLAVFHDGFFMADAEETLDLSVWAEAPWSLDVVAALLNKSLLTSRDLRGEPRFGMHRSIREYALKELRSQEPRIEEEARLRHARRYARLGTRARIDALDTHGGVAARRRLRADMENLLAGLEAGIEFGESEISAHCALAVGNMFMLQGPFSSGISALERATMHAVGPETRVRLLQQTAWLHYLCGSSDRAREIQLEGLALARDISDSSLEGVLLSNFASVVNDYRQFDEALKYYRRALERHREVGDLRYEGITRSNLGVLHHQRGNYVIAREEWDAALAIHRKVGNRRLEGVVLSNIATLSGSNTPTAEALERGVEALEIHRAVGNRRLEGMTQLALGVILQTRGEFSTALSYLQQALAIAREMESRANESKVLIKLALLHLYQRHFAEASEHLREALVIARAINRRSDVGVCLGNLGHILLQQGDLQGAETHLEEAIAISVELENWPAGSFCASLGRVRALQGAFDEARALLHRGEALLPDDRKIDVAKLLCAKACVEHLANEPAAAARALAEAEAIANTLDLGPKSELGLAIAEAKDHHAPGTDARRV